MQGKFLRLLGIQRVAFTTHVLEEFLVEVCGLLFVRVILKLESFVILFELSYSFLEIRHLLLVLLAVSGCGLLVALFHRSFGRVAGAAAALVATRRA